MGFTDYPKSVRVTARRAIERNKRLGGRCATRVGKVRAHQLAKGKPVSERTIQRMFSYLSRAETYYDPKKPDSCGTLSFNLWGGKPALAWSIKKLRQLERQKKRKK